MTDDELIARVLAWETKKFPGSYIAALEFCHERDNELSQSAPDLARRLQKANERIKELEATINEPIRWMDELGQKVKGSIPLTQESDWERYRKKPIVVRAKRLTEVTTITTLEGTMLGNVGDFVIEGIKGELYPCKPDIFEATFEKVKCMMHRGRETIEVEP